MSFITRPHYLDSLEGLKNILNDEKSLIVTDENVFQLYRELFDKSDRVILQPGEENKTLDTVRNIYNKLIDDGDGRDTVIIAAGGGIVCDIAGYVSATYKRGTGLILIPTTLLAQADAALGGKNGVNFSGYKNMIGTFRQPDKILICTEFLDTLDKRQFRNGIAEIIKTAAVTDVGFFGFLESIDLSGTDPEKLSEIISKTADLKLSVVEEDEKESGKRSILNFGHTVGHALESVSGMMHGEAVAAGMAAACRISEKFIESRHSITERIIAILEKNGLPVELPVSQTDSIINAVMQDKKKYGEKIKFIALKDIGRAEMIFIDVNEIRGCIK